MNIINGGIDQNLGGDEKKKRGVSMGRVLSVTAAASSALLAGCVGSGGNKGDIVDVNNDSSKVSCLPYSPENQSVVQSYALRLEVEKGSESKTFVIGESIRLCMGDDLRDIGKDRALLLNYLEDRVREIDTLIAEGKLSGEHPVYENFVFADLDSNGKNQRLLALMDIHEFYEMAKEIGGNGELSLEEINALVNSGIDLSVLENINGIDTYMFNQSNFEKQSISLRVKIDPELIINQNNISVKLADQNQTTLIPKLILVEGSDHILLIEDLPENFFQNLIMEGALKMELFMGNVPLLEGEFAMKLDDVGGIGIDEVRGSK